MKTECLEWLEQLPSPDGVLASEQLIGRESLRNLGLPKKYSEAWRLTNLKRIEKILKLPLAQSNQYENSIDKNQWPEIPKDGVRIILNNETNYKTNLPNGIRFLSNDDIKETINLSHQSIDETNDWGVSVNKACNNKLLALKVDGLEEQSLEILIPSQKETLNPSRILLVLGKKAKLKLLQVIIGEGKSSNNNLIQIHLDEGSELNHGLICFGKNDSSLFTQACIKQNIDSKYELNAIQHGWSISRFEPRVFQQNGKAKTKLNGLQISSEKQQLATHSLVNFNGPEGELEQLQKSIAADQSHCIFNGAVKVPKEAQKTNASQLSRNLLISKAARIDTKPELEIVADDVKCAHGATISQLQEEELFYLRSRGIDSNQAATLLLKGYCQEIINNLPVAAERWQILNQIIENLNK